jgi:hypothetical protein
VTDLAAVLDTLLPPRGVLPGAGALALGIESPSVDRVLAALPSAFGDLDADAREETLRALDRSHSSDLAELVRLAYCAYYTDARVLAAVGEATGYRGGSPQPGGYEVEPFDEAVLSNVRRKSRLYREA